MVTLFVNTLKAPYYKHVIGSSTQQFTNVIVVAERKEQRVWSGRISTLVEKKGFEGKRSTMLKMATGIGKNNFKTTIPPHPK